MLHNGVIRFVRPGLAVLGLALMLGACESEPEAPPVAAVAEPEPQAGMPQEGVIETGAAAAELSMLPPEPPEPPEPVIDDDPQQLYGLDSRALEDLLGEPSLVRAEAPAEIWQYRSQTCVFDVFLYDQAQGQAGEQLAGPRVSYVEARDDAAQRIDTRTCLNELLRLRMGLPLG